VGISFFIKDGKELAANLEIIWRTEIEPYLDEYFYDQPKIVESFRWERLINGKLSKWAQKAQTAK
jgi:5-methylcytosine-specific restriction protein B